MGKRPRRSSGTFIRLLSITPSSRGNWAGPSPEYSRNQSTAAPTKSGDSDLLAPSWLNVWPELVAVHDERDTLPEDIQDNHNQGGDGSLDQLAELENPVMHPIEECTFTCRRIGQAMEISPPPARDGVCSGTDRFEGGHLPCSQAMEP